MEIANKISRQLILWIFIWFIILGIFLAWLGYWEMSSYNGSLSEYQGQTLKGVTLKLSKEAGSEGLSESATLTINKAADMLIGAISFESLSQNLRGTGQSGNRGQIDHQPMGIVQRHDCRVRGDR